jgi:hypothetical protein
MRFRGRGPAASNGSAARRRTRRLSAARSDAVAALGRLGPRDGRHGGTGAPPRPAVTGRLRRLGPAGRHAFEAGPISVSALPSCWRNQRDDLVLASAWTMPRRQVPTARCQPTCGSALLCFDCDML